MKTVTHRETFCGHLETGQYWGHIWMETYRDGDIQGRRDGDIQVLNTIHMLCDVSDW